jgi:hypothetical protein
LPVCLQSGEWSEKQLMVDQTLFHVRLAPMVEGSIWTSAAGDVAAAADAVPDAHPQTSAGDRDGGGASEGEEAVAHDATEL